MTAAVRDAFRKVVQHWPDASRWHIGFSGGLDSTVLLDLVLQDRTALPPLHAIYVDHGLHPNSADWGAYCRAWCREREIDFTLLTLTDYPPAGASVEAWAREARYAALAAQLDAGDVLLTAHHADDQLETFLLQALRGAGPAGLAAIAPWRHLAPGFVARPLLSLTRAQLHDYAVRRGLRWLEDPSNADPSLDRNFLRGAVLPLLRTRWPQAAQTVSRSAHHCAQAAQQLERWSEAHAHADVVVDSALALAPWLARSSVERDLLLRHWLARIGLPLPSARMLSTMAQQLANAGADRQVLLRYRGGEIRRHRHYAYAMAPLADAPSGALDWTDSTSPLALPSGLGTLDLESTLGGLDPAQLTGRHVEVRFRRGGERIRLPGQVHRKRLTELCRQAGIAPWVRDRLPLLWVDGELAAVAETWVAAAFAAPPNAVGARLRWSRPEGLPLPVSASG
ncbi:MAG: tRNA lysidine(34) synthetase TilS [Pseudomonadota bacterium]|nr:tRNA lysidine(34) synthetase TilS [Pseudomonadota bacterium]